MTTIQTDPLPIARYRFSARMRDALQMPEYAGSLLRGQFGAALRSLACTTRQPECGGCPLRANCPYARIFEAPAPASHQLQRFSAIPNAYVVEPPPLLLNRVEQNSATWLQPGQELSFHMVLAGNALKQLPLVILAWQRALAQGLTRSRSRAELLQVEWEDSTGATQAVWNAQCSKIQPHAASLEIPAPPAASDGLILDIHTPLRLQHQGHPLRPHQLNPGTLVSAVARRVALVLEFHAQQPQWGEKVPAVAALSSQFGDSRQLHWFDWTRYSSRQQQTMTLGGVIGQWHLRGSPDVISGAWPWLWLGQWLHVGKNASFGMGGYRLKV